MRERCPTRAARTSCAGTGLGRVRGASGRPWLTPLFRVGEDADVLAVGGDTDPLAGDAARGRRALRSRSSRSRAVHADRDPDQGADVDGRLDRAGTEALARRTQARACPAAPRRVPGARAAGGGGP